MVTLKNEYHIFALVSVDLDMFLYYSMLFISSQEGLFLQSTVPKKHFFPDPHGGGGLQRPQTPQLEFSADTRPRKSSAERQIF